MVCACGEQKMYAKGQCVKCYKRAHWQRVSAPKRQNEEYKEASRAYARNYLKTENGKKNYAKRLEDGRAVLAVNRYHQTDKGKASVQRASKNYGLNHPEKRKAHWAVKSALKNNSLEKPNACTKCASVAKIHAHHHDYSKPLDVTWLCQKCHIQEHKRR